MLVSRDCDVLAVAAAACSVTVRQGSLQCVDSTLRASLARSQESQPTCGGTLSGRLAWPYTNADEEGICRAQAAHSVLVLRDRDTPVAARSAAVQCSPPPGRLGRASAKSGRHAACLIRVSVTCQCRRWYTVWQCCIALRQRCWGRAPAAECGWHAACLSRAIATRLQRTTVRAALRQQAREGVWGARAARGRRARIAR